MELFPVDDAGRLFISPCIDDWANVAAAGIDVVIDLEGGLDECIPTDINHCLYVYFPIADDDEALPPLTKLRAVARLGEPLQRQRHHLGLAPEARTHGDSRTQRRRPCGRLLAR